MNKKILVFLVIVMSLVSCEKTYDSNIVVEKLAESSTSWNGDALPEYHLH